MNVGVALFAGSCCVEQPGPNQAAAFDPDRQPSLIDLLPARAPPWMTALENSPAPDPGTMTKSGDLFALAATPLLPDQVRGHFSLSAGQRRSRVEENQRRRPTYLA